MFRRCYALESFGWLDFTETMDIAITAAIRAHDHPHAQAAVACMTTDAEAVHILIEYWREEAPDHGDQEQGATGTVEPAPAVGQPRRQSARQRHHARAAAGDQSKGIGVSVVKDGQVDVALPFAAEPHEHPPIYWP